MSIQDRIDLMAAIEEFAGLKEFGYFGAPAGWLGASATQSAALVEYSTYLMLAAGALGVAGKMAGWYRKRLESRLATQPLANGG